jgi:hypothetical protein
VDLRNHFADSETGPSFVVDLAILIKWRTSAGPPTEGKRCSTLTCPSISYARPTAASPRTLVYLPYGKSYSLWGNDLGDSGLLLDLGGEKPLLVWAIKEECLGAASGSTVGGLRSIRQALAQ